MVATDSRDLEEVPALLAVTLDEWLLLVALLNISCITSEERRSSCLLRLLFDVVGRLGVRFRFKTSVKRLQKWIGRFD